MICKNRTKNVDVIPNRGTLKLRNTHAIIMQKLSLHGGQAVLEKKNYLCYTIRNHLLANNLKHFSTVKKPVPPKKIH